MVSTALPRAPVTVPLARILSVIGSVNFHSHFAVLPEPPFDLMCLFGSLLRFAMPEVWHTRASPKRDSHDRRNSN